MIITKIRDHVLNIQLAIREICLSIHYNVFTSSLRMGTQEPELMSALWRARWHFPETPAG